MSGFDRFKASDAILARTDLSPGSKNVAQWLVNRADGEGQCWPSVKAIMAGVGLTERPVRYALRELDKAGFTVTVGKHGDDARYQTPIRQLNDPGVPETAGLKADPGVPHSAPLEQSRDAANGRSGVLLAAPRTDHRTDQKETTPLTPPTGGVSTKAEKRPARKKFDPTDFALVRENVDPSFDTDRFRAAWAEWVGHRADIRKKLTRRAVRMQLRKLDEIGVARAVDAIEHSIASGYTGLFEPKNGAQYANRNAKVSGTYRHPNSREKFKLVAEADRR